MTHLSFPAVVCIRIVLLMFLLSGTRAAAATSPYVTASVNVPLNQSTSDSINGVLPYFTSHSPIEGTVESLVDASSSNSPNANVILGPDNTWLGVAWDFGDPPAGTMWQLNRFDAWIAASDDVRRGYRADLSISNTGDPSDFQIIPNSEHWAGLSQNAQYNHVRYDFPSQFIAGADSASDRHSVKGFRYLRVNSRGDAHSGADRQTRFVEFDLWVSAVPIPTSASLVGNNVEINWEALINRNYDVEYKNDLSDGWNILTSQHATGNNQTVADNIGNAHRFYRVVLKP